jgi:DNA-binding MarR family transcriptional regulator
VESEQGKGSDGVRRLPPAAPYRGLGFTLSTLGYAVAAGFAKRLAPLGLEPRDFALMRAIGDDEGASQQAIAERLGIPASRMVAFIDALEQRGLVERRAHPSDRRARALYLTAAGGALLAEAFEAAVAFEQSLGADLGPNERERLLALLGVVTTTLGIPPGVHAANMEP